MSYKTGNMIVTYHLRPQASENGPGPATVEHTYPTTHSASRAIERSLTDGLWIGEGFPRAFPYEASFRDERIQR